GTGLAIDYAHTGRSLDAPAIVAEARAGEAAAAAALDRYVDRLGRALATIVNVVDPDVIVLGGGMSNVAELYERVPAVIGAYVFSDVWETPVVAAVHGDSSGVRGAAWLWPAT
ncbi:MAG TPA: ROK family protein, partial [Caulobacteraceae bacterium]|nr:ROK family protein [Caulobacteraceae bacterium]